MNAIVVVGNAGRDAELKFDANGRALARFSVASNARRPGNRREDDTAWFNIVVFGKLAEFCGQYVQKGRRVWVSGTLTQRKLETGELYQSLVAERIELLSDGTRREEARPPTGTEPPQGPTAEPAAEDDIPF